MRTSQFALPRARRSIVTLAAVYLPLLASFFATTGVSQAQQPKAEGSAKGSPAIDAIDKEFQAELRQLDRRRLEKLAQLAASQAPAEAMTTYEVYLQSALVGSLFQESEAVAEKLISMKDATPQVRWLAQLVNVIGEVDRGAFDQALESVRNAVKLARAAEDRGSPLPAETRVSLIDHFVHRVVQAGRFDIASEALAAIATISDSPDVKETVANWQARIALVGKPAPALAGTDVDGRPYRLADQKGHVVLVWFWATWCVPNAQEMAQFVAFEKRHRAEGLRVVGVNLDALQADARDRADVRAHVKKSLLDQNCPWPNLLCGEGADDHCKAFAVRSIPANYLVGRDGTIVQLDLVPANAEVAIEKALATGASR